MTNTQYPTPNAADPEQPAAAMRLALEALEGNVAVLTRAINAGRAGERYSYIQARDGAMIEAVGPINATNAAIAALRAALSAAAAQPAAAPVVPQPATAEPTDEEIGHVSIADAREALDNMDDYARMRAGVDAMGPRRALEVFIKQVEDATRDAQWLAAQPVARKPLTDAEIWHVAMKWAKSEGWAEFERNDFIACAREILALSGITAGDTGSAAA